MYNIFQKKKIKIHNNQQFKKRRVKKLGLIYFHWLLITFCTNQDSYISEELCMDFFFFSDHEYVDSCTQSLLISPLTMKKELINNGI